MDFHVDDVFERKICYIEATRQVFAHLKKTDTKRQYFKRLSAALILGTSNIDPELVERGLLLPESIKLLSKQRENLESGRMLKGFNKRR